MKRHPWRTSNPREAMLAILPISLDLKMEYGCPGLRIDTILEEVKKVIKSSPIFPTIRHVFIAQSFKSNRHAMKVFQMLKPAGIWVFDEGRGDCRTSLPYTTNYASFMSMRSPNGVQLPNPAPLGLERVYSVNMVGKFDERVNYKSRVALFASLGYLNNSFIVTSSSSDTDKSFSRDIVKRDY